MVNPRPYFTQSITTLYTAASSVSASGAGGVVSDNVSIIASGVSGVSISSAYDLGVVLSTASKQLFSASSYDWHSFCVSMQSAKYSTAVSSVPRLAYTWYNTHADSFNTIDYKVILYRIVVASVISGAGKLVFKVLPHVVFSTLHKYSLIQDSEMHRIDCFDRVVPANKAYCVEVPVR